MAQTLLSVRRGVELRHPVASSAFGVGLTLPRVKVPSTTAFDRYPRHHHPPTRSRIGTAITRFCAQAVIGLPLTPYGKGHQKRGFIPLRDANQCLTIAIENPPEQGKYRVFNQFEEVYSIFELAERVQRVGRSLGLDLAIRAVENPRTEAEEHYNPDHQHLHDLGYQPTRDMDAELVIVLNDLTPHRERIESRKQAQFPDIRWDGSRRASKWL